MKFMKFQWIPHGSPLFSITISQTLCCVPTKPTALFNHVTALYPQPVRIEVWFWQEQPNRKGEGRKLPCLIVRDAAVVGDQDIHIYSLPALEYPALVKVVTIVPAYMHVCVQLPNNPGIG